MSELDPSRLDGARERLQAQAPARPVMMTIDEVAAMARCEHKAVRKAIHEGLLPAFATNRKIVIDEVDAIAWIKSRPVAVTARRRPPRGRPSKRSAPSSVAALREIERNLTG